MIVIEIELASPIRDADNETVVITNHNLEEAMKTMEAVVAGKRAISIIVREKDD